MLLSLEFSLFLYILNSIVFLNLKTLSLYNNNEKEIPEDPQYRKANFTQIERNTVKFCLNELARYIQAPLDAGICEIFPEYIQKEGQLQIIQDEFSKTYVQIILELKMTVV